MSVPLLRSLRSLVMTFLLSVSALPVYACAVCFGDKSSNMARAIWPGVFLLLGVVSLVLAPIVYLGFKWMRLESRQAGS